MYVSHPYVFEKITYIVRILLQFSQHISCLRQSFTFMNKQVEFHFIHTQAFPNITTQIFHFLFIFSSFAYYFIYSNNTPLLQNVHHVIACAVRDGFKNVSSSFSQQSTVSRMKNTYNICMYPYNKWDENELSISLLFGL